MLVSDIPHMKIGMKKHRFFFLAALVVATGLGVAGLTACGKSEFSGKSGQSADARKITPSPTSLPLPTNGPVPCCAPSDEIQSIEVTPPVQAVAINGTESFQAFATYSLSGRRDVTAQVTWTAANAAIGLSQGNGAFKGIAGGTTGITAALDGKSGNATLQVFPGVPAVRVGVNFEDHPFTGDKDFNDAVLCFTGKVAVSPGSVVSLEDQTIAGVVTKRSGCDADMTIRIIGPGTYSWVRQLRASQQPTYQMPFKTGSRLEVIFNPDAGCGDNGRTPVSMYNPQWARIQANVCNTTGN
jgi:hypothetical protein